MSGTLIGQDDSQLDDLGVTDPVTPDPLTGLDDTAVQPAAPAPAADAEDVLGSDDVPEKYRNKTARELLDIVTNQESVIGRHGQELGELRARNGTLEGLVDRSLELRGQGTVGRGAETEEEALTDADFTVNPRDATVRTVRDGLAGTETRLAHIEHTQRAQQFVELHPSAQADMNDQEFVDFVKGSPTRIKLATRTFANKDNIDFEAADELWSFYAEHKAMKASAAPAPAAGDDPTEPNENATTASQPASETTETPPELIPSGGGGGEPTGNSGKPIYSQAALNRLQADKPDVYWAKDTQDRIDLARAEGRVKA